MPPCSRTATVSRLAGRSGWPPTTSPPLVTTWLLVCDAGGRLWPQRLVAMGVLAELEFRAGQWDASLDHAEQAVSLATDSEQEWVLGYLHSTAVLTCAARGDWG